MIEFSHWPPEFAERYRREGYWRGEVLGDLLRNWARNDGSRIAVVDSLRRWTYAELDAKADRVASGLRALGISCDQRVVVQLPNAGIFAAVAIGLFRLGALPVFALPAYRRHEIVYLCNCADAVGYITADNLFGFDYRELARDVSRDAHALKHIIIAGDGQDFMSLAEVEAEPRMLPAPKPSDVAFFLLSGGTTGMPKLIPRTHDDYAYQLRATAEGLAFGERDVYLAALPVAHNAALGCPGLLGALQVGGKAVLLPSPSPDDAFPAIEREGATLTTLIPPLIHVWLEAAEFSEFDLSAMLLQVGSARVAPDLARRVKEELGCRLTQWFGMAEGLLTFTRLDDPWEIVETTVGRPLCAADEIRVVDEHDELVEPGQIGELLTRGPYTLRAYYNADEHNLAAFTSDGFLRTGDLVKIDVNGNMIVHGRRKDVINRGGEKVVPAELEDLLLEHPDIREVAAVGMPDKILGEKLCVFVTARHHPLDLAGVRQFLKLRGVADFKLPDWVENVLDFPKTKYGKIDKAKLREFVQTLWSTRI